MEIAKGIHHFKTGPFNWYVIEESGRLTLVDAGFPGHYKTFADGIHSIGRDIKDVEAVLITHAHADHTGFAARVAKEANAPIFIHEADLEKATKILQLPWLGLLSNAWRPYTATMLGTAIYNGIFTMPTIPKANSLKGGETLDVPGKPQVFHTPGHTPGDVNYYLPKQGILFSGDTLITRDLYTGEQGNPQVAGHLLNYDDKEALRTLDVLREIGNVTMLPGHGKPWHGEMSEAVETARNSARF